LHRRGSECGEPRLLFSQWVGTAEIIIRSNSTLLKAMGDASCNPRSNQRDLSIVRSRQRMKARLVVTAVLVHTVEHDAVEVNVEIECIAFKRSAQLARDEARQRAVFTLGEKRFEVCGKCGVEQCLLRTTRYVAMALLWGLAGTRGPVTWRGNAGAGMRAVCRCEVRAFYSDPR
jgi:hypothetical protein